MKRPTKLAALVILAVSAGFFGWESSAFTRGQLVARFEPVRGHHEVLALGLPVRCGLPITDPQ
jgi:hypothetical protein